MFCTKCGVSVRGDRALCPLCQGELTGEPDGKGEAFPYIPTAFSQHGLFLRILLFCSVAVAVICVAINAMVTPDRWWSLFVLAGLGSMWATLVIVISKRKNIPKNIMWQVTVITILAVVWDYFTGWHRWSIDYVMPIVCIFAMIAMAVIARILKLRFEDYLIYLILDGLFGIVPVIFILAGWLSVIYPSVICAAVSVISLTALLSFEGERMRKEIKRRLHL